MDGAWFRHLSMTFHTNVLAQVLFHHFIVWRRSEAHTQQDTTRKNRYRRRTENTLSRQDSKLLSAKMLPAGRQRGRLEHVTSDLFFYCLHVNYILGSIRNIRAEQSFRRLRLIISSHGLVAELSFSL